MLTQEEKIKKQAEVQQAAYDAWLLTGRKGTALIATAVGKTRIAILPFLNGDIKPGDSILITAPELFILESWKAELSKWGVDLSLYDVHIVAIQSAYKYKGRHFTYGIGDEIHNNLSSEYSLLYDNNSFDMYFGISATLNDEHKAKLSSLGLDVMFEYDINQAVNDGIVSPFDIVVIEMYPDAKSKNVKHWSNNAYRMISEREKIDYFARRQRDADLNNHYDSNLYKEQARFIYSMPSKITSSKVLLNKLLKMGRRVITFSNDVEALSKVTENYVASRARKESGEYNFGKSSKENKELFRKFQEHEIDDIGSFKMLKQGANLNDVDTAIIMSYFTTERDLIQRLGRIIRWKEGKRAKAFILVTKGTREEEWLRIVLANIDPSYITVATNNLV